MLGLCLSTFLQPINKAFQFPFLTHHRLSKDTEILSSLDICRLVLQHRPIDLTSRIHWSIGPCPVDQQRLTRGTVERRKSNRTLWNSIVFIHILHLWPKYDKLMWSNVYSLQLPVVPHKAVAEIYRRGWLLWITDGRANPLMDWKVVEVSSLFLSLPLSFSLFLSLFLSLSLSFSDYLPTYLPIYQCLKLTTSKTKQFCETSSISELDNVRNEAILRHFHIFQVDNIKNEAILRDFVQKWKVECRADGLVPMSFAIFPVHLSKLLHLPRKSDARSYELLHLSRHAKSSQQT